MSEGGHFSFEYLWTYPIFDLNFCAQLMVFLTQFSGRIKFLLLCLDILSLFGFAYFIFFWRTAPFKREILVHCNLTKNYSSFFSEVSTSFFLFSKILSFKFHLVINHYLWICSILNALIQYLKKSTLTYVLHAIWSSFLNNSPGSVKQVRAPMLTRFVWQVLTQELFLHCFWHSIEMYWFSYRFFLSLYPSSLEFLL
jgi:hypothetical protein